MTTYATVNKALAALDPRFVLVDDSQLSTKGVNYCSIRLAEKNGGYGVRKVFCIYYLSSNKCTIHCAKRFESVCDTVYKLNSKKTEYTLTCSVDVLPTFVKSLLSYECHLNGWDAYTEKTTATKRSSRSKKQTA